MASIFKPGNSKNWSIVFWFEGKQYTRSLKVENKRDAVYLQRMIERKLAEGTFDLQLMLKTAKRVTRLSNLVDQWTDYIDKRNISEGAKYQYRLISRQMLQMVGDMRLRDITPVFVQDTVLLAMNQKYASPATIRSKMTTLRVMFSFAERSGLVIRNPFIRQVPRHTRRKPVFFKEHEIRTYLDYWKHPDRPKWQQTYFLTLLETGNRKSEHFNLHWSKNVFLDEKMIKFIGKGNKERIVPLSDMAIGAFATAHRRLNRDGVFWQVRNIAAINSAWGYFKDRCGFPYKVHNVRSNKATWMIREGVPLQDVMDIMGWEDYQTAKIYLGYSSEFVERHRNKASFNL